ncbi:hypothetical protein BDQ12DRAFT_216323 [Crucibulum laeve]|uniref:DUF6534 domain-containing protein n=1 Tax=Crucibulum laeve TaxID=68775 RepID=A0A5C3LY05_9AGAR|nr:hypothetical protein BDQ12DRAFT_216323 [Crucibulum laeve]
MTTSASTTGLSEALPAFNNTLGAAFIGGIIASILYGITCVQTFIFLKGAQADRTYMKIIVICLWIIDTVQHIFVVHSLYYYMVSNYGNPTVAKDPTWSLVAQLIPGTTSDTLVRSVYALRIWRLTHRKQWIVIIGTLSLYYAGAAYAVAIYQLAGRLHFLDVNWLTWLFDSALPCAAAVDAFIAIVLCFKLYEKRTGFRNTDSMIKVLMVFTINTGMLMTIGSTAVFITYAANPDNFIYIGVYLPTSKIYINSLLTSLNAREYVRGPNNVVGDSAMPIFDNEGSMSLTTLSSSNKSPKSQILKSSGYPQVNFGSLTAYTTRTMPAKVDVKDDTEISTI